MNRIIFLNIDGVLGRFGREVPHLLDPDCARRVRRLLGRGTGAVLSSSWPSEIAAGVLGEHGIELYDVLGYDRRTCCGRPKEILAWLDDHPEVTSWVALDDDRMTLPEPWRLVLTDSDVGVTDRDADAAAVILVENRAPIMPAPGPPLDELPCDDCGAASVFVDDHLPQFDPAYGCAVHTWPATNMTWRATRAGEHYDKRGRID